jgi:hypothetical protein
VAVFYDKNCSHCRKAIPEYRHLAQLLAARSNATRVAFIEIPPYEAHGRIPPSRTYVLGRLTDDWEWFATTPVVAALHDGMTVFAFEGGAYHPRDLLARLASGKRGASSQ